MEMKCGSGSGSGSATAAVAARAAAVFFCWYSVGLIVSVAKHILGSSDECHIYLHTK